MPIYTLENIETGEKEEMFLKISEKEAMVESGEWKQVHDGVPAIVSQHGSTIGKTSGDWKDLLKATKKGSGRGNTINV